MKGESETQSIAVIGAGVMGHAIAQEFAVAGFDVRMMARSRSSLDKALHNIVGNINRLNSMSYKTYVNPDKVIRNIQTSVSLKDTVNNVDIVMEYVVEDVDLKKEIFSELDTLCPSKTIFVTGTSSIMPSDIAVATQRPDKVLAAHCANPPYLLPFVEIVGAKGCSARSIQMVVDLMISIGKDPVVLRKEIPGFAAMRLQGALLREALYLVEKGVLDPAEVDVIIRTGIGRRWSVAGVFEVFELAGWDLISDIAQSIFPDLESNPNVSKVLLNSVKRGNLGVKTNKGFYDWTPESTEVLKRKIANALIKIEDLNQLN